MPTPQRAREVFFETEAFSQLLRRIEGLEKSVQTLCHDELAESIAQQVVQQLQSGDLRFVPKSASKQNSVPRNASPCSEVESEVINEKESLHIDKMEQYISPANGKRESKKKSVIGIGGPMVGSASSLMHYKRNVTNIASDLLRRKEFEMIMAALILMNALVMCLETQYHGLDVGKDLAYPGHTQPAPDIWPGAQSTFNVLDWMFGLFFATELVVKLACWKFKYFYDCKGLNLGAWKCNCLGALHGVQCWNWLDFFCVVAFFSDKIAARSAINPQILRLLRLFRLWRLVRLLRFFHMVDHLYVMVTAISALGTVLSWAICLLTAVLMTCDLFLVQILQVTYFNKVVANDLTDDQLRNHQKMYEYFGTCTRGMLSMFEITMGNWPPIARLLSEQVSEWFTLICLIHKLTIGFAVIGVITAIILQETFKVAQTDDIIMFRQKQRAGGVLRAKMKRLFDVLDESGDGQLAIDEFRTIGDFPEIKTWLSSLDIETDDLDSLFELIDVEGKDYVTLDELVMRIPRIKGNARSIDMLSVRKQLGS